ncbi:NAD(P)-binding protein [Delitschia confertaspora ATCC 74209]|uniref:NAD(P)-binding protein n=1 Tax=Delitschia confertaspora ATCC 74209 TaxID=1513339 RepID=A0A9P4MT17_9PLEO|nr:NAD(P)-binding protein [Delitschia confertaspora ATCC 74209]
MTDNVPKKWALITGCSPGGIGHALAREFESKVGYHILATVRDPSKVSFDNANITALPLEVTSPSSIFNLYTKVEEITSGRLDILVNNAGCNYTVPALDVEFKEVQHTFNVNVFAIMRICQVFAPLLIEAQGTIVQIGSLAGVMPYVFGATYNATKAALHAYSNTLRVELAPLGVKVVTIVTGGVKSNIARTEHQLPVGSYYHPVNAEYQRRLKHSQEGAMDNEAYARSVVRKVLRGDGWLSKTRWIWEGKKSWIIWFVQRFLPLGVMDYAFTHMFNLWKLRGTVGPAAKKRI